MSVALAFTLGARAQLPLVVVGAMALAGAVAYYAVAIGERALVGEERLVYYHHELAVLAAAAGVAALAGRPVWRALDVTVAALGVFLAFGRLGCFSVGCCYGAPHRLGLRYRQEHADVGFPHELVGAPLLPVQVLESAASLALACVAAWRVWSGAPAGTAFADAVCGYALVRFSLELLRGDALRPELARLSEAQWWSVGLAAALAIAGRAGALPPLRWRQGAALALALAAMATVIARGRRGSLHRLLGPRHVEEVARALVDAPAAAPRVSTTSLGVRLSACVVAAGSGEARLYTVSGVDARSARALSSLILKLKPSPDRGQLVERRPGLFQLVVTSTAPPRTKDRLNPRRYAL
jgi:hypothetical protein